MGESKASIELSRVGQMGHHKSVSALLACDGAQARLTRRSGNLEVRRPAQVALIQRTGIAMSNLVRVAR